MFDFQHVSCNFINFDFIVTNPFKKKKYNFNIRETLVNINYFKKKINFVYCKNYKQFKLIFYIILLSLLFLKFFC